MTNEEARKMVAALRSSLPRRETIYILIATDAQEGGAFVNSNLDPEDTQLLLRKIVESAAISSMLPEKPTPH